MGGVIGGAFDKFLSTMLPTLHRRVGLTHIPALSRQFSQSTILKSQTPVSRPPPRPRPSNRQQLPLLPLIAIFILGSGSFYYLAKSRVGQTHQTYTAGEPAPPKKEDWPGRRKGPTEQ